MKFIFERFLNSYLNNGCMHQIKKAQPKLYPQWLTILQRESALFAEDLHEIYKQKDALHQNLMERISPQQLIDFLDESIKKRGKPC